MRKHSNGSSAVIWLKRTPLLIWTDGLLLLLALNGLIFSFLTAYEIPATTPVLLLGCSIFAVAVTFIISMKKYRRVLSVILSAAWLFLLIRLWDDLKLATVFIGQSIVDDFPEYFGFSGRSFDSLFSEVFDAETAVTMWSLMVSALLAVLLSFFIIIMRSWWLTALLTILPLVPAIISGRMPEWIYFAALLICCCTMLLNSLHATYFNALRKKHKLDSKFFITSDAPNPIASISIGRISLSFLLVTAILLTSLSVIFPKSEYKHPQWAKDAQEWLINFGNRNFTEVGIQIEGITPSIQTSGSYKIADLANAGPRRFSGRTVLEVENAPPGPLLLRGYALAQYTGKSWTSLNRASYKNFSSLVPYSPFYFPADTMPNEQVYQITVCNVGAAAECVYAPYQLLNTTVDEMHASAVNDLYLERQRGFMEHVFTYRSDLNSLEFMTLSSYGAVSADAEKQYRNTFLQYYLEYPEDVLTNALNEFYRYYYTEGYTIQNDAPLVQQHRKAISMAQSIAIWLDRIAEYDPETPKLPEGEDFVAYFLDTSHRGYCMHFASAGTLILRAMGIPARYVDGFSTMVSTSGTTEILDSNAHAWVEIYLNGYGWYPVEMTPGYESSIIFPENSDDSSSESESSEPVEESVRQESSLSIESSQPMESSVSSVTPGTQGSSNASGQTSQEETNPISLNWLWIPIVLLVIMALSISGKLLLQRQKVKKLRQTNTNHAVIYAYQYLSRMLRWAAWYRRDPEEWVMLLAYKAKFSQHVITETERNTLCDYLDSVAGEIEENLPRWKRIVFRYFYR